MDASTLIEVKRYYPGDIKYFFGRVWELLSDLAGSGRLFVAEQARDECLDDELNLFFDDHPEIIVPLSAFEDHLRALARFSEDQALRIIDPSRTKTEADPLVVALGLCLDKRDPHDLLRRSLKPLQTKLDLYTETAKELTGCVVSEESGAGLRKIPEACERLNLAHLHFLALLRAEGYTG